MGTTNFDRFRELIEKKNSKPTQTGPTWFKTEKGVSYSLRFLPLKSQGLELPVEFYHHHAIKFPDGRFESFACRQRRGEGDCPFCKLASDTWKKHVSTGDESYKDAFKQLVAKTQYLLVGYEPSKVDVDNITEKDLKIVRASSKAAMEQIETALSKGKDFVDFTEGRNIDLRKPAGKGDVVAVIWEFDDQSVAFPGKNGKATWDKLVELSPDLTAIISSPTDEKLAELIKRYGTGPTLDEPEDAPLPTVTSRLARRSAPKTTVEDTGEVDLDALRAALEE
jgi:hypothetical protein